jgi:hypothetical protein
VQHELATGFASGCLRIFDVASTSLVQVSPPACLVCPAASLQYVQDPRMQHDKNCGFSPHGVEVFKAAAVRVMLLASCWLLGISRAADGSRGGSPLVFCSSLMPSAAERTFLSANPATLRTSRSASSGSSSNGQGAVDVRGYVIGRCPGCHSWRAAGGLL